jgi:hypothetical protein
MPDFLFDPEDGGNMFFQNIDLSLNYTVLNPEDCALHSWHHENLRPNIYDHTDYSPLQNPNH